jgi:putative spermidine/putrescine transport system ATP-binding protein
MPKSMTAASVLVRESAGALSPSDADDRVWLTFRPDAAAILA